MMALDSILAARVASTQLQSRSPWRRVLALAASAAVGSGGQEVFDGRCWAQVAEADKEACEPEDPCRSDCWTSIFSHSYCCVADSPCWWWGRQALGDPVRTDVARSGVECRHLCQAEPSCSTWSYFIPADADPNKGGPCLLRAAADAAGAGPAAAGVVSGPRICNAAPRGGRRPLPQPDVESLASPRGVRGVFNVADAEYANEAARALGDSGWAVLRRGLGAEETAQLGAAARAAEEQLLQRDPSRLGNRGPRRYSFGGASSTHHMVHVRAWAELLDLAALRPVLEAAFGGPYVAIGGGGDFVLGSTDTHQRLHVDLQLAEMYDHPFPPAAIVANVAVSSITCNDGPMRFVPKTQMLPLAAAEEASRGEELSEVTSLEKEGVMMRRLGLTPLLACPLEPGDILLRDMRLWHGGAPNRGEAARLLPSAEFLAPWYADLTEGTDDHFAARPALPFEHWWRMSSRGREAARRILSAPGPVDASIRPDFALVLPYVAEERP
mmetsp:Transcript_49338/g.155121  ORF Transcript_49338/g.155121 Transcript_49338/m.155121 type:complete len:497 (+) Transcript_49338:76-1566(+)